MVKSGDIVYRKSKYKLPPTKSSKKSKITVMNPYLKPPKTKVGPFKFQPGLDPSRPPTATVTTFKKLGDEEFKIGCLKGYKFCLAGVLYTSVEETEAMTMYEFYNVIIKLGGTITSNVDKTTDYLVLGSKLEDGRAVNSSSRYIKAKKVNRLWEEIGVGFPVQFVSGLDELSGLLRSLSDD
jgi:NAD-dependent DNA ligase